MSLLWQKLLSYNINGKILTVIRQMYNREKLCIKKDNMISEYFLCNIGVRQGDTLSPLLFPLFINDVNQYISTDYRGLNIVQSCYPSLNDEDIVLLKLFVLLYADDTIILAENEEKKRQLALDKVHQYCAIYKLSVNIAKSKIIVFSRGKEKRFSSFKYGFDVIEVVSDYVYLGITMNYNNKFDKAMK